MLLAADAGILFDPPQNVVDEFQQLPVARGYEQLKAEIAAASTRAL
jgi:phosphoserine/homoserine phosphotransferase